MCGKSVKKYNYMLLREQCHDDDFSHFSDYFEIEENLKITMQK